VFKQRILLAPETDASRAFLAAEPANTEMPNSVDLSDFGTVLFASGFRPDFASWIPWPDAFDDHGFPKQSDGASDVVEGLYFVGIHFVRKRKSGLFAA
jgi:putative flavoprotein involved in K+ transport